MASASASASYRETLQRLTLALGASEDRVEAAVEAAMERDGDRTAASRIRTRSLTASEAALFFTVSGLSDSKDVVLLHDRTTAHHDALIAASTSIRYVLAYAPVQSGALDSSNVAAHMRPGRNFAFASPTLCVTDADVRPRTPTEQGSQSPIIAVQSFDVRDDALRLRSQAMHAAIHAETPATLTVRSVAQQLQSNISGADVDGAARSAASHIVSVVEQVDATFDATVAKLYDGVREAVTAPAPTSSVPSSFGLQLVEAILRRYTAVAHLLEVLEAEDGAYGRVLRAGRADLDAAGSDAQMALGQRIAGVRVTVAQLRREAWAIAPLVPALTSLGFLDSGKAQSIAPMATECIDELAGALLAASLLSPTEGAASTSVVAGPFFEAILLPLLTHDVVSQVNALLGLASGRVFRPRVTGGEDTHHGVPAVDSDLAPLCLSEVFAGKLRDSIAALRHWATAARRAIVMNHGTDHTVRVRRVALASSADGDPASAAAYAADRCADLSALIGRMRAEGHGLLPPTVMGLFAAVDHAVGQFPPLFSQQYRNWAKLEAYMEKAFVLKYPEADTEVLYREDIVPVTTPPPVHGSSGATVHTVVGGGGARAEGDDDEKLLLRVRVSTLTAELADCRRLLAMADRRAIVAEAAGAEARATAAKWEEEVHMLRERVAEATTTATSNP